MQGKFDIILEQSLMPQGLTILSILYKTNT